MKEIEQMSMIEVAEMLMSKKKTPQPVKKLIKEVAEMKGLSETPEFMTQLYIDITTSAKFVYCGNDEWDLKERQSLDLWDKDGSFFNQGIEEDEEVEDDNLTVDDYNLEVEAEEDEEDIACPACGYILSIDEVEEYARPEGIVCPKCSKRFGKKLAVPIIDDDVVSEDTFIDEEEYNDMMDDYEDLYDK